MRNFKSNRSATKAIRPKPHAILGAGQLVSAIWKTGSESTGWRYRFNVFRMGSRGRVEQRFAPECIGDAIKLIRLIAITLADEAATPQVERRKLKTLAQMLDGIASPGVDSEVAQFPSAMRPHERR